MSVVAVALVLAALVALLLRTSALGGGSALVCILLGVVIGLTPAGPSVQGALDASGAWLWGQVGSL